LISAPGFRQVHFVGSVPLASAEAVFRTIARLLGDRAPRIPDGETGPRSLWIQFQRGAMDQAENLSKVREYTLAPGVTQAIYRRANAAAPVRFGRLGYASAAIESYRAFSALKREGLIPDATRFQVSLPTPLAVTAGFIEPDSQECVEPAYEAKLIEELQEILRSVPTRELAIQWDVAYEVLFLAGFEGSTYYDKSRSGLLRRLAALGGRVPVDVAMGYHLCYGDPGHKHLVEPTDLALCVDLSNALTLAVGRSISWLHMPVPRGRHDAEYFSPLRDLSVPFETTIYLGLIHLTDGVDGSLRRLETASKFHEEFGVATECGFGRRDPKTITDLLLLHKRVAQA
jgi:hypothetical protein